MVNASESVSSSTVVARPTRRSLAVTLPAALGTTALMVVAYRTDLFATLLVTAVATVLLWRQVALALMGRATVGADGVDNRISPFEHQRLPWEAVAAIEVRTSVFGRVLKVVGKDGKATELAAPREGVFTAHPDFDRTVAALRESLPPGIRLEENLTPRGRGTRSRAGLVVIAIIALFGAGAAFGLDQPWKSRFWPGRHEASSLPPACGVLTGAAATALVPSGTPAPAGSDSGRSRSECRLDGPAVGGAHLRLQYELFEREPGWGGSGSALAHDRFARIVAPLPAAGRRRTAGLGDEATSAVLSGGAGSGPAEVVARRANVVVTVDYTASVPAAQEVRGAERVARTAVARIRLG